MKLGQNICHHEISDKIENGSFGSKTRPLGQILKKKPCLHSRGHIFSSIIMKLGQNICLHEILDKVEVGSCQAIN